VQLQNIDTLEDKTFTKMKSLERNNQDLKTELIKNSIDNTKSIHGD
jgi:hypothetical protein